VSLRLRAPDVLKVDAMLAAAATAIVGGAVAGVVVEADAVRAAADTMAAAVGADDGKASLVDSRESSAKTKFKGRRDAALFVYTTSESRTTNDRLYILSATVIV